MKIKKVVYKQIFNFSLNFNKMTNKKAAVDTYYFKFNSTREQKQRQVGNFGVVEK